MSNEIFQLQNYRIHESSVHLRDYPLTRSNEIGLVGQFFFFTFIEVLLFCKIGLQLVH